MEKVPGKMPTTRESGAEYLFFVSSRSLKTREKYTTEATTIDLIFQLTELLVFFLATPYFQLLSFPQKNACCPIRAKN